MSKFIFLDTNNWIYLSNGFNIMSNKHDELHLKIFDIIEKRVNDGSIKFLINDIVLEEWERNKSQVENQIKSIANKYNSYLASLKSIKEFVQHESHSIEKVKSLLNEKFKERIKRQKIHIQNVENFLKNKTIKIDVTDKNKIDASDLAIGKSEASIL